MMMKDEGNDQYSTAIDMIKCFACLGVISIHFSMFYGTIYEAYVWTLVSISVPCFMSVSGYLLFFRKRQTYQEVFCGSFARYLSVFLIWSLLSIVYSYVLSIPDESFIHYLARNSEGWHLWYLKVYLQILFCYLFIAPIVEKKEIYIFYSILWIIFISMRYSFGAWFSVDPVYLRIIQLPFFQYSGSIGGTIKGYYPMEALGLFILGGAVINYFEQRKMGKNGAKGLYYLGTAVGVFVYILTSNITALYYQGMYEYTCDPYMINVVVMMLSFITFVYLIEKYISNKMRKVLHWLANKTLGVYILQSFVYRAILAFLNYANITNQYYKKIMVYFGVVIGGVLITSMAQKVLPKRLCRYLI